ncbi:MAG: hypothetical protein H6Q67_2229, partial [Firmicutes bacterium]|nr:hypothetical protein [Bacillota bacterium]
CESRIKMLPAILLQVAFQNPYFFHCPLDGVHSIYMLQRSFFLSIFFEYRLFQRPPQRARCIFYLVVLLPIFSWGRRSFIGVEYRELRGGQDACEIEKNKRTRPTDLVLS